MHPNDETLLRLLDGELSQDDTAAVQQHLSRCDECQTRVDVSRDEVQRIDALLRSLDHDLPHANVHHVLARAKARRYRPLRWAAGIVLVVGVSSSVYAAVINPTSRIGQVLQPVIRLFTETPDPRDETAAEELGEGGGIAVVPADSLAIMFPSEQSAGEAVIRLTDSSFVMVRAVAGSASYTSDVNRLEIRATPDAVVEIEIPRGAPNITVSVSGRVILQKIGARMIADAAADSLYPITIKLDQYVNR